MRYGYSWRTGLRIRTATRSVMASCSRIPRGQSVRSNIRQLRSAVTHTQHLRLYG